MSAKRRKRNPPTTPSSELTVVDSLFPSVSALFLKKCGKLDDRLMKAAILRKALARAKRKSSGTRFRLKDLFPAAEWGKFPKGARINAGADFLEEVNTAVHGIRADGKSSSNHQYCIRC